MLSNEDKSKLTETELQILYRDAAYAARQLGKQLVRFERNPDPKEHLNAPNPADGIRIRLIRPRPTSVTWGDDVAVKQHNEYVASLGRSGKRFEL